MTVLFARSTLFGTVLGFLSGVWVGTSFLERLPRGIKSTIRTRQWTEANLHHARPELLLLGPPVLLSARAWLRVNDLSNFVILQIEFILSV